MYAELHTLGAGDDFLVEVVNIDNDPALVHRYGARIPVLVSVHDDSIISEHFLDKQAFLQALA